MKGFLEILVVTMNGYEVRIRNILKGIVILLINMLQNNMVVILEGFLGFWLHSAQPEIK